MAELYKDPTLDMILLYMYCILKSDKAVSMADMNLCGGQCGFCCCVLIIMYSSSRQQRNVDLPIIFFIIS